MESTKIPIIEGLTIASAQAAYKAGTYTCHDLISAYFARIKALDTDPNGPRLNSILAQSRTALDEALALDAYLKDSRQFVGSLHGIPVLVKDQVETKGLVTTYGSVVAKDHVPSEDAMLVKKLKAAGAVVLAKTTMPDWATGWFSTSSISGMTRNPYALDRDTGGSSSGTASAIAANLAILGLGEDTGGSIRLPSSYCGLVGLRPTPGMISRSGLCPLIKAQDTPGPMTRTVEDAALMFDVLVGFDAADPYTSTAILAGPPVGGSYAATLESNKALITKSRIGVLRSAFGDSKEPEYAAVNGVIESAFKTLADSGTTFVDIEIPNLAHYLSFTPTYITESRSQIDTYLSTTSPTIPTTVSAIHASSLAHPALQLFADIATGFETPTSDLQLAQRLLDRDTLQNLVISVMATHDLDAIAFPDSKIPAPLHSDINRWSPFEYPTNTLLASQARMPAITVPAGRTEQGLPIGLELVGLHYREQKLLELAYGIEKLVGRQMAPKL
ncbi:hypothetical protein B7463_g9770, partial [Scytalidium lignicola]